MGLKQSAFLREKEVEDLARRSGFDCEEIRKWHRGYVFYYFRLYFCTSALIYVLLVIIFLDLCETVQQENFKNPNSLQFIKNSSQMEMQKRFQNLFLMFLTLMGMEQLRLVFTIELDSDCLRYHFVLELFKFSAYFENHNSLKNSYKLLLLHRNRIWIKNWTGLSNSTI